MTALLLTIHFIVAVAMIGVILLQRSEGGALGLGGGGGMGGLMSGRGAANALSRTTVILAAVFITTSITLALLAKAQRTGGGSILAPAPATNGAPSIPTAPPGGSLLPGGPSDTPAPAEPAASTPAAPAATSPAAPAPVANQPAASAPASAPTTAPAAPAPASPAPASTPPVAPPH